MESCEQYQNQMLDYVYDLLEEGERTSLQRHLTACMNCPTVLATARRQQGLLARASKLSFPDIRFKRPVAGVTLAPMVLPFPRRTKRRRLIGWAVAAALLISVGGLGAHRLQKWAAADTDKIAETGPNKGNDENGRDMNPAANINPGPIHNLGSDWGPETKGLAAGITLDGRVFRVGQPIVVKYRTRNTSTAPIGIWHSGFWRNHRVIVHDAADQDVPFLPRGERNDKQFAPRAPHDPSELQPLGPDKEESNGPDIYLTQLFKLTQPGTYTVRFVYEERQTQGWDGTLESNTVKFEIEK
jgi:hypothetical protein